MKNKDYQADEKRLKKRENHNNRLIAKFKDYLEKKSLKPKTIGKHIFNIKFFANNYLLYYDDSAIEEGFLGIGSFLGYYFIRKTNWSSKSTILENITSIKKFYTFMQEIGKISKEDLDELKESIKDGKEDWLEEMENYMNNIEVDDDIEEEYY